MIPGQLTTQDKKSLHNEEQYEAIQARIEKENIEFLSKIDEKSVEKYLTLLAASKMLANAGIRADINAMLPSAQFEGRECLWSFCSLSHMMKWKDGKISKESDLSAAEMIYQRVLFNFNQFARALPPNPSMGMLIMALAQAYHDASEWLSNGVIPPLMKELMDVE